MSDDKLVIEMRDNLGPKFKHLAAEVVAEMIPALVEGLHAQVFGVHSLGDPNASHAALADGGQIHEAVHALVRALPARIESSHPIPANIDQGEAVALDRYDAGLLPEPAGGIASQDWWQDAMRAELDRAHEFYADQVTALTQAPAPVDQVGMLREALTDIAEMAEYRIQDGVEMGAAVWRIALEDIAKDARSALTGVSDIVGEGRG